MDSNNLDASLLEEIEAHAIQIARQAGQILLEKLHQPMTIQFKDKKNIDPVTSADHLSDEYLKKAISHKFTSHSILSEEGGALGESNSAFVWVIDPLDGTANYMNGLPLFAVSIGVLWKGQPVAGSIFVPVSHRAVSGVYHARLGQGAFLDKEKIEVRAQPSSHPLAEIPAQFGSRFHFPSKNRKEQYENRNLGSITLEMALAASGIFQYAFFGAPKLWDIAAGVLVVKEAGGLSFFKKPKAKDWLILERFDMEPDKDPGAIENLRRWSFPIVAGAPESTRKAVQDIRIRRNPLSSLGAWFRRQSR